MSRSQAHRTDPLRAEREPKEARSLRDSRLYTDWYYRVGSGHPNDYIIAITADPRFTGVSGTGKTTMGAGLAKWYLDISQSGYDAEIQYTQSSQEILPKMYAQSDEGSALIYDEAQGTPSGTGLNSKRSMKNEALEAINTIATRRKDRKTLIVISQSLKSLNKDLFDFIDAWILITDDVDYRATHYSVQPDVFNLETRKTKTPGVEELTWDPLPANDPDYKVMEKIKDEQSTGSVGDSEEETGWPKDYQIELAQTLRDEGWTLREIANHDKIEFTRNWVSEHTDA
jgi:hypothetical protein